MNFKVFALNNYYKGPINDHFDGKQFYDPEAPYKKTFFDFLKWRITAKKTRWPSKIANVGFDNPPARIYGSDLRVSYIGHVTFLIQTAGLNILTDPVWSKRASPFEFVGPKRVIDPGIKFEDLPKIDLVWISHNHYDHLDLKTIDLLFQKHKPRIITPLGNDSIIKKYNSEILVEAYDLGDEILVADQVKFHLSPMQHWSARGLFDRNKALWAALTIETKSGNIYFVGDSGYGNGRYFKKDQEKFGNYRLALLPMGAYQPKWFMEYAHMSPEDMIKSHLDLGMPYTIPSHFDVFPLADDEWGEA